MPASMMMSRWLVLWSKIFPISGPVWNAAAFVENPNLTSSNPRADYVFKIYDKDNLLIDSRTGGSFDRNDMLSTIGGVGVSYISLKLHDYLKKELK